MSLQARMSEHDPRLYNVNRDLAHCFGTVMMEVAARIEDQRWPFLTELLRTHGVSDESLGEACAAVCRFVISTVDNPKENMHSCLARSGFFSCHEAAQVAVMAVLGTVVLGIHWVGVREATLGGVGPVLTYADLGWRGSECAKLMSMSRWRRRWLRFKNWLSGISRAFRGQETSFQDKL